LKEGDVCCAYERIISKMILTKIYAQLNVWNILNLPWNGMFKEYAPFIVVVDGPHETLLLIILGRNRIYASV
jgi:hypothetical protein